MRHGKETAMGLGPLYDVPLAEARVAAAEARKLLRDGIDPLERRRKARLEGHLAVARGVTFEVCAKQYITAHQASWGNAKHRSQWHNTLDTYVNCHIGSLPVSAVDTALVLRCIEKLWEEKP